MKDNFSKIAGNFYVCYNGKLTYLNIKRYFKVLNG